MVEADYHGGWAWHGTYWEYVIISWYYTDGPSPSSYITITVDYKGHNISDTFSRPGHAFFDPANPRDCEVTKVRYTPSTDVLEFI